MHSTRRKRRELLTAALAVKGENLRDLDRGSYAISPPQVDVQTLNRLTLQQKYTAGMIAVGLDGGHHHRTLGILLGCGVIERYEEPRGKSSVYRYRMPITVHTVFQEWNEKHLIRRPT